MAEIIATGTTQGGSADFTLTDGQSVTLFLKDATGPGLMGDAVAWVQIKATNNEYYNVGCLDISQPARVLQAAGTYRVYKTESQNAFGVDKV